MAGCVVGKPDLEVRYMVLVTGTHTVVNYKDVMQASGQKFCIELGAQIDDSSSMLQ